MTRKRNMLVAPKRLRRLGTRKRPPVDTLAPIPSLDELIGATGQTGVELAKNAGISMTCLRKWLRGDVKRPCPRETTFLAAALGVDFETARAAIVHQHIAITRRRQMERLMKGQPIHHWIVERMGEKQITQEELAEACEVDRNTLYRWIRGKHRPGAEDQITLAMALQLPVSRVRREFAA